MVLVLSLFNRFARRVHTFANDLCLGPELFADGIERKDTHQKDERPERHKQPPQPPPRRQENHGPSLLDTLYDELNEREPELSSMGRDPSQSHKHVMPDDEEPLPRPQFQVFTDNVFSFG